MEEADPAHPPVARSEKKATPDWFRKAAGAGMIDPSIHYKEDSEL